MAIKSIFDKLGLDSCEGSIVFDPSQHAGRGWKVTNFRLQDAEADEGDGIGNHKGIDVAWEATVAVVCKCVCPPIRHGVRVIEKSIAVEIWLQRAGEGPIDLPTPTSIVEGVGEAIAAVVDSNMPKTSSISNEDLKKIATAIKNAQPSGPRDGQWKGGKSPCKK